MQLTVDRSELIAAITEKRDEVAAKYQKVIDNVQARIDALEPAETVEDWLRTVADLIKDGKVRAEQQATMSRGAHPGTEPVYLYFAVMNDIKRKGEDRIIPKFPNHDNRQAQYLTRDLDHAKSRQATALEPYDGALKILNMSTDEKVGIGDGDYAGLLSGRPARHDFNDDDLFEGED
jgi:hypothetical protein